jgi:hypothetical protein
MSDISCQFAAVQAGSAGLLLAFPGGGTPAFSDFSII